MDLSIIIVNWNSVDYLDKCLDSMVRNPPRQDHEIIVVDNASYDGSHELIQRKYQEVVYIQSEQNGGFAYANNLGFRYSTGNAILFLNPDTEVLGAALSNMYDALISNEDVGGLGCTLLNSDYTIQKSCIQSFPTFLNQLFDSEFLRKLFPGLSIWGNESLNSLQGEISDVEVVIGACLMIKRDVFKEVNMFSEDYFLYSEDLDLCFKIRQAGHKMVYLSGPKVIHHGGGSTNLYSASQFSNVLMRESVFRFMKKHRGMFYAYLYRIGLSIASILRILILLLLIPSGASKKAREQRRYSIVKWYKIFKWSLGGESWARKYSIKTSR